MQFAGAYQSIVIKRNSALSNETLEIVKGDKQPISAHPIELSFTNNELQLHENDQLYLFTDGFIDQFGGERNKKFGRNRFYKLIESFSQHKMEEQKNVFNEVFEEWSGKQPQIDDILLVGIKI